MPSKRRRGTFNYKKKIFFLINCGPIYRLQPTDESVISDDDIIRKMIREEVQSYEALAKTFLKRCKTVEVCVSSKEESQGILKDLIELQDISSQATESTDALTLDIQSLKVSLNETYLMIAELKSKHSLLNDAKYVNFVKFEKKNV